MKLFFKKCLHSNIVFFSSSLHLFFLILPFQNIIHASSTSYQKKLLIPFYYFSPTNLLHVACFYTLYLLNTTYPLTLNVLSKLSTTCKCS